MPTIKSTCSRETFSPAARSDSSLHVLPAVAVEEGGHAGGRVGSEVGGDGGGQLRVGAVDHEHEGALPALEEVRDEEEARGAGGKEEEKSYVVTDTIVTSMALPLKMNPGREGGKECAQSS